MAWTPNAAIISLEWPQWRLDASRRQLSGALYNPQCLNSLYISARLYWIIFHLTDSAAGINSTWAMRQNAVKTQGINCTASSELKMVPGLIHRKPITLVFLFGTLWDPSQSPWLHPCWQIQRFQSAPQRLVHGNVAFDLPIKGLFHLLGFTLVGLLIILIGRDSALLNSLPTSSASQGDVPLP